jgi:hypothetical protein
MKLKLANHSIHTRDFHLGPVSEELTGDFHYLKFLLLLKLAFMFEAVRILLFLR